VSHKAICLSARRKTNLEGGQCRRELIDQPVSLDLQVALLALVHLVDLIVCVGHQLVGVGHYLVAVWGRDCFVKHTL